ncbi:MAG: adenylate cyclase [Flavobacteriales bacterium]|jgi:adenylate cyclase
MIKFKQHLKLCKYFFVLLLCLPFYKAKAQNQKVADSLKLIYKQNNKSGVEKLELLRNLSFNEIHDIKLSVLYANELIRLSKAENNYTYLHRGYLQKGNAYRLLGDLNKALDAFFKSNDAAFKAKFYAGQGSANMSIADVYSVIGNPTNARIYYEKAITILRRTNDTISLAKALLNAGEEYANNKDYNNALAYYNESGILFKKLNYEIGTAYNIGNKGMLYAETGDDKKAMNQINTAIYLLEKNKDYYAISDYLTYMSDIYINQNKPDKALQYASQSLKLAQKYGLKKQISISNEKLSELYQRSGNYEKALQFYKKFIVYKDSLNSIEIVQKIADTRTNYEISQKQI